VKFNRRHELENDSRPFQVHSRRLELITDLVDKHHVGSGTEAANGGQRHVFLIERAARTVGKPGDQHRAVVIPQPPVVAVAHSINHAQVARKRIVTQHNDALLVAGTAKSPLDP
jgi:hypothetical protein